MLAGADNAGAAGRRVSGEPEATDLERLFNATFLAGWRTLLVGGGDEPLYLPADDDSGVHRIIYRSDYFASALHEVAHWCIAGDRRRSLPDYGYWYAADGRDAAQQAAFERVEIRPQALEWLFATAAGQPFRLSADNLQGEVGCSEHFRVAVLSQVRAYCHRYLPPRAARFARVLADHYRVRHYLDPERYCREALG